jgi:hypothetical protein
MAIPAIIHLLGEDAIMGDLDTVPQPTDQFLFLRNLRKKDGKPLAYVDDTAQVFLFAWHKVTFVELMVDVKQAMPDGAAVGGVVGAPSGSRPQATTVLGFFREDE